MYLASRLTNGLTMDRREQAFQDACAIVAEAKRLSLSAWFEQHSGQATTFARNRHHSTWCPACGLSSKRKQKVYITDDAVFACSACPDGRGSILDAEMLLYGGTLTDAARRLLGRDGTARVQALAPRHQQKSEERRLAEEAEKRRQDAASQVVHRVCVSTKDLRDSAVLDYLTGTGNGQRGLPLAVVEEAINRNIIRMLPSNPSIASSLLRSLVPEPLLRTAGLWKEDKPMPWIAYRPLWSIAPGALDAELRIIRKPRGEEMKSIGIGARHKPYYWEGKDPRGCAIVEGSLDMLAMVALGYEGDILALKGVTNWDIEWFVKMAQARGTRRFDTAFDNDDDSAKNNGQLAAMNLGKALVERGLRWKNVVPPSGDINDLWLSKVRK